MSDCLTCSPKDFDAFAGELLSLYRPPLRARSTHQRMAQLLGMLRAEGFTSTADLTTPRLALWIAARTEAVSANTLIGELGYLATACEFAVEERYLDRNPFRSRRLTVRAEPPCRKQHHSMAEVSRVLASLRDGSQRSWQGHRLYALAATVAYTGVRRNEALYLRQEHVDLDARVIAIVPTPRRRLKTVASAAPVPVADDLVEVLEAWLPESQSDWVFPTLCRRGPWTGGYPGTKPLDRLKEAGRAVGVEGLTWQSLRHSWATHAETAWGLTDPQIQRVLRHTSPLTSKVYRHADLDNLRGLVRGVSYRGQA